jgi:hypothetical protein
MYNDESGVEGNKGEKVKESGGVFAPAQHTIPLCYAATRMPLCRACGEAKGVWWEMRTPRNTNSGARANHLSVNSYRVGFL